jgi:transposase
MQTKRRREQTEMMILPALEQYVPESHPLRRLNRVLDLRFVHDAVRDRYCQDNGRPSIDPEVVVRLFLLQAIEGIGQVRRLMQHVQVNLAYRLFIGYEADEVLPDHSTLSKALDRFGEELFDELFQRSIQQCQRSGLIEGKILHLDATTIRADIDRDHVGQAESSDPDARYGHFPDGTLKPGYKQQTVTDGESRVIVALAVMPANESEHETAIGVIEEAMKHLDHPPEVICADGAYASGENKAALEAKGIRFVSPPPKPVTYTGNDYFTVADFVYDQSRDEFVCPAGATLVYVGGVKARPGQRCYRAGKKVCGPCSLKEQCTRATRRQLKVGTHHAALIRLRADSKTEDFQQLYRGRAPTIEGVFAEAKQRHGLRRAWRRGLSKMRIQCLLIAAVINFKRLITRFLHPATNFRTLYEVLNRYWMTIATLYQETRVASHHTPRTCPG